MTATKQDGPKPEVPAAAEPPKKDIMGIERDDKNCRVSFTPDGGVLICTMPIAHMPRVLAHGFVYELHTIINEWYAESKNRQIITRDQMNKFSFKSGINKILGRS